MPLPLLACILAAPDVHGETGAVPAEDQGQEQEQDQGREQEQDQGREQEQDQGREQGQENGATYRSTVSARRYQPEQATTFPQEVLADEAKKLPLIDSDLYRSLHLTPGVQADDYTARFALRGGESEDLLTLVDGVPLFDPFHLQDYGGAISAIGLDAVESTTLLGDGFPASYGERMGGVIEVRTKEPGARHEVAGGLDLLNAHAVARGPLGDGGYLFAARRGYIDLFLRSWAPDAGFLPAYHDLFGKLERRVGKRDRVSLSGLWAVDTNEIQRESPDPDLHSRYTNGMAWARWERRLPGQGSMVAALAYGHASRDRREGSLGRDLRDIDQVMAQQDWTVPLGRSRGKLRWGGRLRYSRGTYDYRVAELVDLSHPDRRSLEVQSDVLALAGSAYVQHDARPWSWLQTTVGVRADRVQGVDSWDFGPRLAVAILPHPVLSLRAAWGLYHQPVTPHELPVEAGVDRLLPAERAEHRVLGLQWRPGRWLHLRLEGYWRTYDDLVGLLPNLGREERAHLFPDQARVRGLEVEARGFPGRGRIAWVAGYTLSRAEEWVAGGAAHPRPGDRTHALTAGLDLDLAAAGHLSLTYRYHSGVPYTPATGLAAGGEGEPPRVVYGEPASARLPAFHSLDARLTRTWGFTDWALSGYLQVMNATVRDNVQEYVHEVEERGGELVVARKSEGYFPILPTLGVEARF